jgi:cytochrome P450
MHPAQAAPAQSDGPYIPLYTQEFAANPHLLYRQMRDRYGSIIPVALAPGVNATLVIGYQAALRILHDSDRFPADPRTWQTTIPDTCPIKPMMEYSPAARHSTGEDHERYRHASATAIAEVDLHALHHTISELAVPLINTFCETGHADLVTQYALPLVSAAINDIVGCSEDLGQRATSGTAARFDSGAGAVTGKEQLMSALTELIELKRAEPGDDATSRMVEHPAGLNDHEIMAQLMSFYGAGVEASRNLITNTVLLMLTDERFGGSLLDGSLSIHDAIDEVLFNDPPIANFCTTYPRQPVMVDNVWLPAHEPVVISLAACNNDPAIASGDRTGNRAHLAWSAGPHACPAEAVARLITEEAILQLLDYLPDMELSVNRDDVRWRPGPFHRALASLPVQFSVSPIIPSL